MEKVMFGIRNVKIKWLIFKDKVSNFEFCYKLEVRGKICLI